MTAIFGSALIGAFTFWMSIPGYLRSRSRERTGWWTPRLPEVLARRVRTALSRKAFLYAWNLFLPSTLGLVLVTSFSLLSDSAAFSIGTRLAVVGGYLLGVGLAFGLSFVLGLREGLAKGMNILAMEAATALARRGVLADAEAILGLAAHSPQAHVRRAAAFALRYLGTPPGDAALALLADDRDKAVREAARSSQQNVAAILHGDQRESVIPLVEAGKAFSKISNWLELTVDESHRARTLPEYKHLTEVFERVVYAQLPLRRSFPHLFCMDCRCRAEEQAFEDWSWVRCKRCHDVFGLKSGVVTVVGQVGGVADWELQEGTLRLSLWDVEARRASGAEIDLLELRGGSDISYDWAVSAVVEQLVAFQQVEDWKVRVRRMNLPVLDLNTENILRRIQTGEHDGQ